MPLLRQKLFQKVSGQEKHRDSDEVFYCATTNEIFSNYEDYFHHVVLISSIVWTCEITGKPNLTYTEALESEKQARKLVRSFPAAVKGPFLLVASHTKRSSFNEMLDDVFGFVKDHYFKGETVDAIDPNENVYREAKIVEVIPPSNKTSPVKAEKIKYRVRSDDGSEPKEWTLSAESIKRDRSSATRDKCKVFLKQNVEQVNGVLRIKDAPFKKHVTDEKITDAMIFFGKPPDFGTSKSLQRAEEKKRIEQEKKKSSENGPKKRGPKPGFKRGDGKQQSMTKYLNKSSEATDEKKSEKNLKQEMERKRQEKAEKEALEKKLWEERKAILTEQVAIAIKKFNTIQEDLELNDQKIIPEPKPVSTIIDSKHFSDFMYILEFMTSFSELLSIKDKFSNGLSMDLLERALLLKEVNGPLSDIFQVLLSTIFSHQVEEENEVYIRYDTASDFGMRKNGIPFFKKATLAGIWCETHYCAKLNELPMDSTTVSEILRLHFLSSGALIEERGAKWRYSMRGGYHSSDDPGIQIVLDSPHILKALSSHTVFQLPVGDVLKILKCLIDQLLTYSSVRELIEERLEKAKIAKQQYLTANVAKRKREGRNASEKWDMRNEIKKKVVAHEGTVEEKAALRKELEEKMAQDIVKMDADTERDVKNIQKDIEKCKINFFDYQIYLGSDRAHRSYWLFESLPGLFVEYDQTLSGKCLQEPTPHIPGLASCPADMRKKFITQTIMNNKLSEEDKENHANKKGSLLEKLMLNGSAKIKALIDQNKTAMNGASEEDPLDTKTDVPKTPSNAELLMCTANPKTCPVHGDTYSGPVWGFFHTEEEINALIESLNPRGIREKTLRENLENEKELILTHLKDCPVDQITAKIENREEILAAINAKYIKKYDSPDFNHEPGTNPSVIFEATLRENLLELESKISIGYLGSMKVTDREEWRSAIERFDFKQLSAEQLRWGRNRLAAMKEKKEDEEEQDEGMENDESDDDNEKQLSHDKDPGYDLPDQIIIDSDDSTDEAKFMQEAAVLKEKVHNLATALLQIEQCIDPKFLCFPFGAKTKIKDKTAIAKSIIKGQKNLARWEESLMRATNYSQIFLHYNVLYDTIQWNRSAERIACMICRRKGIPEQTLLCDDCNRACHMYCLKPKLKQVPEGDWYCPKCRPDDYKRKRQPKKRQVFVEEEPVEEEEPEEVEEEDQDATADDDDTDASTTEEALECKKCKETGATAVCSTCFTAYHPDCTKSLSGTPKKRWNCDTCKKKSKKSSSSKKKSKSSKKSTKKVAVRLAAAPVEDDSFENYDDDVEDFEEETEDVVNEEVEEEEEVEEPTKANTSRKRNSKRKASVDEKSSDEETLAMKVKKGRRSSAKRSLTNGFHDEDENDEDMVPSPPSKSRRSAASEEMNSSNSRKARRTGDDLPLNSVALYTLLDDIFKHPDSWPFDRPVSVKEVPDYYTIIKNPMDFAKIKSKLNMGEYTINEQMMNDIQLVFRNCDLYNTDETEIYRTGQNLERFVLQRSKELSLPFKPSDMLKHDSVLKNGTSTPLTNGESSPKSSHKDSSSGKRRSTKK